MFGRSTRESLDPLAFALWQWPTDDRFSLRDLLNGGILILGRPGSGKSSSSSMQISRRLLAYPGSGGLILAASNGDRALWQRVFAEMGRSGDLIVFDEHSPWRFNFIDFLLKRGGGVRDVAKAITNLAATLGNNGQGGAKEGDKFFAQGEARIHLNTALILSLARDQLAPAEMMAFIDTAALEPAQLGTEAWIASFHGQCLKAACEKPKTRIQQFDYELARTFWMGEFPAMSSRTRSSLISGVMNTYHLFCSGMVRELVATRSNLTPEAMDHGRWVLVDTPVSRLGEEGAFLLGVWKFAVEFHVLKRDASRANPPLIIHADEIQNILNPYDSVFLSEARKFGGCLIALSQSVASFYANMPGERGKAQTESMLNNFSHKIFHALGDVQTAEWASKLVGNAMQITMNGSQQGPTDLLAEFLGRGAYSGGFSEQVRAILEPKAFMHGLRTGGPESGYRCDAVVIRSGEAFANGDNWLKMSFSQL